MPYRPIRTRALDEVEGGWGDLPSDATTLMRTAYALRRKPIGEFTVEHRRVRRKRRHRLPGERDRAAAFRPPRRRHFAR